MKAALEVIDRVQPDVVVGLRRLRLGPGLPRGAQAPAAPGRARGQRAARASPTSSAPGSPPTSPPASRTPTLPHARYIGLPIRRMISTLDRAALRAEGARVLRARPGPADAAGDRRVPGRPPAQPVGRRGGARLRRGRGAGAAHRRSEGRGQPGGHARRAGVRHGAVRQPDGPRVRRRRRRPLPGRAATPSPRCRASACRRSTCRCRSATASRRYNARPVVDAGGGLLVADAALTPEWVTEHRPRPAHRRRAPRGDVGGRRRT